MKLYIVAAFFFVCVMGVLSTSPMNCAGCHPQFCTRQACECGSYKDECNCCDRCFKCPGQECNYFAGDRCMLDEKCTPPEGLTITQTMISGRNGICAVPEDDDDDDDDREIGIGEDRDDVFDEDDVQDNNSGNIDDDVEDKNAEDLDDDLQDSQGLENINDALEDRQDIDDAEQDDDGDLQQVIDDDDDREKK